MKPHAKKYAAFSILELIAAIAVLSILLSFLFPSLYRSVQRSRRVKDRNNLRQLVMAYKSYVTATGNEVSSQQILEACSGNAHIQGLAKILAQENILKDPFVLYSSNDFRYRNAITGTGGYKKINVPRFISDKNGNFNADFYTDEADVTKIFPLCVEGFSGIPSNAPESTTPLFFTRGIETGGWGKTSPYQNESGGFIAFLDGHVEWFDSLGENPQKGKLTKYQSAERTNKIEEAVPESAIYLHAIGCGTQN